MNEKQQAPSEKPTQPGIRIAWDREPPALAVDFVQVTTQQWGQFALAFCAITPGAVSAEGDPTEAKIVASLRINPLVFLAMIRLMAGAWNNFSKENELPKGTVTFEEKEKP